MQIHYIDTSVILEPKNTEEGFYCRKYIQLVGYKYRGMLSLFVLGELLFKILNTTKLSVQLDLLDMLNSLVKEQKISFCFPKNISDIDNKIKEIDYAISPVDRLIVTSAVEYRAVLVTIDSKLIHNRNLEKTFGIKIEHPRDLL